MCLNSSVSLLIHSYVNSRADILAENWKEYQRTIPKKTLICYNIHNDGQLTAVQKETNVHPVPEGTAKSGTKAARGPRTILCYVDWYSI